jgi:hypothetical protein
MQEPLRESKCENTTYVTGFCTMNHACAQFAALYCANMKLAGDFIWTSIRDSKSTSLWLNGASIKNLRDDRDSWPGAGGLHLDGLQYQELTLHSSRTAADREKNSLGMEHAIDAEDRIEWLSLQPSDKSEPQPWMQLPDLLKAKGDIPGSKRVIFAFRRVQARPSNRVIRWWRLVKFRQDDKWAPDPTYIPAVWFTNYAFLYGTRVFLILAGHCSRVGHRKPL